MLKCKTLSPNILLNISCFFYGVETCNKAHVGQTGIKLKILCYGLLSAIPGTFQILAKFET
jgi:hypothetical protein